MGDIMSSIVSQEWLKDHLNDPDLLIVDCRFNLSKPEEGQSLYSVNHIPGAYYFDLEKDMSSEVKTHGGRHPLPNINEFTEKLVDIGLSSHKKVIAYDDQEGAMAARLWWLLQYIGHDHDKVKVLGEDYTNWKEKGYPITQEVPHQQPKGDITPNVKKEMTVTMEEVKEQLAQKIGIVIDSRAPERYRGDVEPIDAKAGHIPGAINRFWKENRQAGKWLTKEDILTRFKDIQHAEQVTVYCGSGVTACANLLALSVAGISHAKLYPGSWSDWISYPENPIAKK